LHSFLFPPKLRDMSTYTVNTADLCAISGINPSTLSAELQRRTIPTLEPAPGPVGRRGRQWEFAEALVVFFYGELQRAAGEGNRAIGQRAFAAAKRAHPVLIEYLEGRRTAPAYLVILATSPEDRIFCENDAELIAALGQADERGSSCIVLPLKQLLHRFAEGFGQRAKETPFVVEGERGAATDHAHTIAEVDFHA
jgi:hypothetical protein